MGRRNKLGKFAEILSLDNVFENFNHDTPVLVWQEGKEVNFKGKWRQNYFKNDNPLILELACGKGDYTIGLAKNNPACNYMGVDIKGARIWRGAKTAKEENLENVAFLRTRIEQIGYFFEKEEVDQIWITFADPFLKKGKENRRLTNHNFLDSFKKFLKPGGIIHLKTDEPVLYEFTLEVLQSYKGSEVLYHNDDIYAKPLDYPELEIKTFYEKQHLSHGKTIKYIRFKIS